MVDLASRLDDKVVLVTGGGSGLGKGAAQRIVADGAAVGLADIRPALAEEVAAELGHQGGRAVGIECDVTDEDQVAAAVETTVRVGWAPRIAGQRRHLRVRLARRAHP
jgi:NAD(P)-dependent dehydrogenase (short-subunit alcohol dehydrogenase family)